jgi:hypothetical protein
MIEVSRQAMEGVAKKRDWAGMSDPFRLSGPSEAIDIAAMMRASAKQADPASFSSETTR